MLAGLYLTNKFYICIYIPICYFMNFEQLCEKLIQVSLKKYGR